MPRTVASKWQNRKRGTYTVVGAFSVIIPFILLSYYVFGKHPKISSTLQIASVVFRHGERTPTHFYPNDPYKDPKLWPDGFGALTQKGKQQMYKLGVLLRERYSGFLNELYSPEDIYVMSSDHDRCLMSAQLCLAGLYPPVGRQIWKKDLAWQPVPVHTVPRNLDKLIVVKKPCPKYDVELNKTYYSTYFAKINEGNADLFKYLTEHSGMTVENLAHLESLYNTLEVEVKMMYPRAVAILSLMVWAFAEALPKRSSPPGSVRVPRGKAAGGICKGHAEGFGRILPDNPVLFEVDNEGPPRLEANLNFKLPEWAGRVYDEKMKNLAALNLAAFTYTDTTKRLKGGPILGEVVDHMSKKILGSLKPNRVLYLYSGHDLTMISVLRALGFEELFKPDYGAAMFFELHQPIDGGEHIIELLYLNNTDQSTPIRLKIPGCDEMCKLKDFLRLTRPMIPTDWETECQAV